MAPSSALAAQPGCACRDCCCWCCCAKFTAVPADHFQTNGVQQPRCWAVPVARRDAQACVHPHVSPARLVAAYRPLLEPPATGALWRMWRWLSSCALQRWACWPVSADCASTLTRTLHQLPSQTLRHTAAVAAIPTTYSVHVCLLLHTPHSPHPVLLVCRKIKSVEFMACDALALAAGPLRLREAIEGADLQVRAAACDPGCACLASTRLRGRPGCCPVSTAAAATWAAWHEPLQSAPHRHVSNAWHVCAISFSA